MKFPNNQIYNEKFSKIPSIEFYPYVGQNFGANNKRILVFAHNIPVSSDKYEKELKRTADPNHFANQMVGYAYDELSWAKAFRNFIKGSVGLTKNYNKNSDSETIKKVDEFVKKIAFTNFINGLVKSDSAINTQVSKKEIERSKNINNEILKILNVTHCVCWGKHVYNYILKLPDFKKIHNEKLNKRGFGYAIIENINNHQQIHLLKVFHPSMPGFGHFKKSTHEIFNWFYKLQE